MQPTPNLVSGRRAPLLIPCQGVLGLIWHNQKPYYGSFIKLPAPCILPGSVAWGDMQP